MARRSARRRPSPGASRPLCRRSLPCRLSRTRTGPASSPASAATGVVTIGAIIGMAAHLEGKGCGMIDMAGLAQKGGSVYSHVKVGRSPEAINAIRVSAGQASLILGGDLVVSGTRKVLAAVKQGKTLFVANTAEVFGGEFTRNADFSLPVERLKRAILASAVATGGLRRRHGACDGPLRQLHRRQHVPARLRPAEGRRAARLRRDRAGDRAQRRGRADEHRGLPLGSPRRARPRLGRGSRGGGAQAHGDPQALGNAAGDGGPPRRVPHRLPGRRLCPPLPRRGGAHPEGRDGPDARPHGAHGIRRPASFQAHGLQGRV